jgi:ribonucleotide monophosphatase NagD (HAD superfamily)
MDGSGAFTMAKSLIAHLNRLAKPYFVLTNGSRFLPEISAKRYREAGLAIGDGQVISSGSLIQNWVTANNLYKARAVVLGPAPSHQLVQMAGLEVLPDTANDFDVLIVADQGDVRFPEMVDHVISVLYRMLEHGKGPRLLLPNPDLVFPRSQGAVGITSGSIALIIEAALNLRFREENGTKFERLGKPFRPIFEEALRRSGTMNMALLGDQIDTDVAGANLFGIASILVGTGIARKSDLATLPHHLSPRYFVENLALEKKSASF